MNNILTWQKIGFGITAVGGTLLHFLYEWTNGNIIAALFSGVNESTWEHMKLMFFPMFIFAMVQSRFFKEKQCFWSVKLRGILTGIGLIPIFFYTYNGVIGKSPDWINISFFFIAAAVAYIYETKLFRSRDPKCVSSKLSFFVLCVVAVLFFVFTFYTPKLGIFKDPLTNTYGI